MSFSSRYLSRLALAVMFAALVLTLLWQPIARASSLAQIPTGSIATVTNLPQGAVAVVLKTEQGFANVRSGPGTLGYEIVGVLVEGQQVPALGRTLVGDWIEIAYPGVVGGVGWVWKDLIEVRGDIPIITPPATSTPLTTPTIDPTLAAQFLVDVPPTRLPTYTPAPPVIIPTYAPVVSHTSTGRVPIGFVITGLVVLGVFGLFVSLLRGR
jgi:uncharacterized protein YraI